LFSGLFFQVAPARRLSIFTGQMLFLTPNQQRQSTEDRYVVRIHRSYGSWA